MSELQSICADVLAVADDIVTMAQQLHAEARNLRQASSRAASTVEGSSARQARQTVQALQNAAEQCDRAAQQLQAAENAGKQFVARNCGG